MDAAASRRQVGAIMGWDRRPLAGGPAGTRSKSIIGSSSDCEWAGVFGPAIRHPYECGKIQAQKAGDGRETNERATEQVRAASMGPWPCVRTR